uniref:Uncharacterized protein n=1 Tax=Sphaerodactylus townsendi TaxID=933632 RepID=A0ACB8GEC6_9SAUR
MQESFLSTDDLESSITMGAEEASDQVDLDPVRAASALKTSSLPQPSCYSQKLAKKRPKIKLPTTIQPPLPTPAADGGCNMQALTHKEANQGTVSIRTEDLLVIGVAAADQPLGDKLFSNSLDKILMEATDKSKAMPRSLCRSDWK